MAVRSGDDVIVVDRCGPTMGKSKKKTPMKLRMFLNGELTEGTEVFRQSGGKKYTVNTDVIDILVVQADVINILVVEAGCRFMTWPFWL